MGFHLPYGPNGRSVAETGAEDTEENKLEGRTMKRATDRERFFSKVHIPHDEGCWVWTACVIGPRNTSRYGQFNVPSSNRWVGIPAHRWSYEFFTGKKIPIGLVMDHICKNQLCVRPDHLRVVTQRQNVLENSNSITAINLQKTHCKNGHEFSGNNFNKTKRGRVCRICQKLYMRQWRRGTQ